MNNHMMIRGLLAAALGALMLGTGAVAQAVPVAADVVLLVDESGSMGGEHAWIPGMVTSLETGLTGAGVGTGADPNRYAVVGFGGTDATGQVPHKHISGGNDWFPATGVGALDSPLVTSGFTEDGWNAIDYFFNNYAPRANAALNLILITDEDRDNQNSNLSYAGVLNQMKGASALLNAVVNCNFADGAGNTALGVDAKGKAYLADGSGGFTSSSGGQQSGSCFVTTLPDYVQLAWDTGGAAWDLNQLRAGGLTADSFTAALVNIKVTEISSQPPSGGVPEPASLALVGLGLAGLALRRRPQSA